MAARQGVLLTGATGLLGRFLLRDLLLAGHTVAVLVRDAEHQSAAERIAELLAFWGDVLESGLPDPLVIPGELNASGLNLSMTHRRWLQRQSPAVLHAAANLSFRTLPGGEPWQTNVEGTRALLQIGPQLGLFDWHYVSTAYVCGRSRGPIAEGGFTDVPNFNNPYEQSKFEAEQLLRRTSGVRVTFYRPTVIVGDSETGFTSSYQGFYRFLELASRLASPQPPNSGGFRTFPVRLPFNGDEPCQLVPVDWVSRAIVELIGRPQWHGRTFHLSSWRSVPLRVVQEVAAAELQLTGVTLVGREKLTNPSRLEQLFLEAAPEYWPYLSAHAPVFSCANAIAALPELPQPRIDRSLLARLIRFAIADNWGRKSPHSTARSHGDSSLRSDSPVTEFNDSFCRRYIEELFPRQARQSALARVARLDLAVGIDIRGPGGGRWTCRWEEGELRSVQRGLDGAAALIYHTDTATFEAIVQGGLSPQLAFFEQRIDITGDLETALKLALLFDQFLADNPCRLSPTMEATDEPVHGS